MDDRSDSDLKLSERQEPAPVEAPVAVDPTDGKTTDGARDFGRRLLLTLAASLAGAVLAEYALAGRVQAMSAVIGFAIGLALFHLLGGRGLIDRYRLCEELSLRDGLTGVGNHRAFQEEIRRATSLAHRTGQPLAAAMVDIVDFKSVNDRFGHRHGDGVLKEVARELAATRGGDHAFRVGGDEFVVLFPATGSAAAEEAFDRVREGVRARTSGVRVRAGIAELGGSDEDAESLWARLDVALNTARRRGDPVAVADPAVRPPPAQAESTDD